MALIAHYVLDQWDLQDLQDLQGLQDLLQVQEGVDHLEHVDHLAPQDPEAVAESFRSNLVSLNIINDFFRPEHS